MFKIGDLVVYSGQGICFIDDICEKTMMGETKEYYVLHPVDNSRLTISIPVDNDKVVILDIIQSDEAEKIIDSFKEKGIDWIEINSQRNVEYSDIVKTGNRSEIAKVVNTLMRKKYITEINGRKFYEQDTRLLVSVQNILFSELAMSLDTTFEEIKNKVLSLIEESEEQQIMEKGYENI